MVNSLTLLLCLVLYQFAPWWVRCAEEERVFLDGSEDALLELASLAEKELKVFVYPIPKHAKRCNLERGGFEAAERPMFQMELDLPLYLKGHPTVATLNPDEADIFLVDHEWLCLRIGNGVSYPRLPSQKKMEWQSFITPPGRRPDPRWADKKNIFTGESIGEFHVEPIWNSVVRDYPYFNRSGGRDHAIVFVMDNGPFCGGGHIMPFAPHVAPVMQLLENVTIIGNLGIKGKTNWFAHVEEEHRHRKGYDFCFRENQDITIPQLFPLPATSTDFGADANLILHRSYDIYFRGNSDFGIECSPWVRVYLDKARAARSSATSVVQNTETNGGSLPDILWGDGDMTSAFFALCPAGAACWSMRLYDAIFHNTIPVILADPVIEPFERFLNWRSFTIKYNTTIIDSTAEPEEARVQAAWDIFLSLKRLADSARRRDGTSMTSEMGSANLLSSKVRAMHAVTPWLSFPPTTTLPNGNVDTIGPSAYKLVLLELWCRTPKGRVHEACNRPVSTIAHASYE